MKVQIFFVFLLVLLSNAASADYLECYVCEDCEENEAHLEYCSPIEEIQSALKPDLGTDEVASTTDADDVDATVEETNSADNTTAFTHLAIDAGNVTATDLDSTKVGVTATSTSATITQTTNSATGINDTTLTNSTTTVLSSVPLEVLTTDEEDPEISSDIDDHTISNQTTAGTLTTNGINGTTEGTNQIALGTEVSALSTLNTTETTKITESMAEGTTKNVTVNNGTATGEVGQTTIEIMEANATTLGEDMMVAQTNKTSTAMQSTTNTTDSKESFENMELDHENSTLIEDNALEATTLENSENFTENITSTSQEAIAKNLTSVLNNSTTSKPNEINTPLKNETAGQSHETTINFTIGSNSTVSPFIDINITDVPGLTVTTSEVVANTTNFARPNGTSPISNITAEVSTITNGLLTNATNGNFGNTTSMEDSNEVEISNQTVVEIGYGSLRPNGTSQIGTVNGNFENTAMEDSNEVEISNQIAMESGRPNGTSQIGTANGSFGNTASMIDPNEVEVSNQTVAETKPGSGRPNGTSQIGTANENFGNTMEDSNEVDTSNQTIVGAQPESGGPNGTSQIGTGNGIGSGTGGPNGTSQIVTANGNFGNTSMEDSNEVEISNQTIVEAQPESARPNSTSQIGTGNGIGSGPGRPNGTSQIGTANENFGNTMEDSDEVEISNQTIVEAQPESARPNSTSQIGTGNGIGSGSGRPNGTSQIGTANENFGSTTLIEDSNEVDTSNQTTVEARPESARPNSTSQINTGNGIGYGSGRPNGASQVVMANGNFGNSTSMEDSNEVEISNQAAVGTGPESGRPNGTPQKGTANGSFGNTTLMEDSNEVDTSNQTAVGARPESGRPNSTSQIGIANGNFGSIASIEDSNEIEMNNQTSNTVSSLMLTNSTHFAVENTTTAGRPNSTLHIAIDSGNITSMDEFNNQTLSNETAMGTKPIGEVTASSLVTTNTTNTVLLNATDMPNPTESTKGVLTNTTTVDGLNGLIGGNFGNITVDISEELNGTKQVNIKTPDLQQMPGTTNVNISSTTAAANSNGTREAFPTEEGMEGLLGTNSVNFQNLLMEVPNGITQAEINFANSIEPSNTNGILQLTTAEAPILDGNSASKGDSSSFLFATEKEKLLPKTLKHSRSTLSKINTDKEVFNTKKATAVSEVQRDALRMHQANEFKFARDELKLNPARFIQHKYSRIGNAAGVKLGNITYKCYSVRVKGKNKVQLNKGCVAVPAEKTACELLAAKYGKEALVDCEICVKDKCNRSSSIGLKLSQKSLALIMLLGLLLGGILS